MSLLLYSTVKVSVIVAVALAAAALLRPRSASVRHWVLSAAIVCAGAVPALELVAPRWPIAIDTPRLRQFGLETVPANVAAAPPRPAPLRTRHEPVEAPAIAGAGTLLGYVWIAGVVVSLSLLLVGFARLTWLASRARGIDEGRWREMADDISRECCLRRPVTVLQSAHPALLLTWGWRRPKVLLPAGAGQWSDERLRIVFRHELAHVRRGDWPAQLAAEIVRAVYWFNPLLWIAARQLRRESEQAADDAVLSGGVEASEYAGHLLELARALTAHRRPWCAAPAMARPSSLERRVAAMLSTRVNRDPLSPSSRLAIGLAAAGLTVAIAGAALAQSGASTLSGSVTDPSGAPLSETTVSLMHRQTGASHAAPTDQAGYFEFASLPAGEYSLEGRVPGFAVHRDTITLSPGERVQRDIRMTLGTVQETITVRASSRLETVTAGSKRLDLEALRDRFRGKRLQPPIKLKDVRPLYPQALADAGVEGRVVFEGWIGTDGTVTRMRSVASAHPDLVLAAREAVSQWLFEPTRLWGSPVEVAITVAVDFQKQP